MTTNVPIDDRLLRRALRVGKFRTKRETVTRALEEFIEHRRQKELLKGIGTFDFREDWDYLEDRLRRKHRR